MRLSKDIDWYNNDRIRCDLNGMSFVEFRPFHEAVVFDGAERIMQQISTMNDIERFTQNEESRYFDRKSARKDVADIAKHIIAFANAAGGKLVVGIEDDGVITGFRRDKAHEIESFEQIPITLCEPSPTIETQRMPVVNCRDEDDFILVIDISASDNRVISHRNDGKVFLREGDKSVQLNHEQTCALEYDKGQTFFENEIANDSSIADIDPVIMARYKRALETDVSDEQVLKSRGFLRKGHLTKAGVLLFCENPSLFFPWARVRVLKFDGIKMETGARLNIVKDRTFDGPIPRVIDEAKEMISNLLRDFQYLGEDGKFKVIPEYPEFAWFEGLVNAVVHRDYSFTGDYIRVSLYDDRLEIFSPGKLPNIVTIDNMRTTRFSRNPGIARTLVELGWVRELNEGVKRIYDEMQNFFLRDPTFSEPSGASLLLTLENSITSRVLRRQDSLEEQLSEEVLNGLNEYEIAAVQYVYGKGKVSARELAELTGRSGRTASTTLKGLAEKNILKWHGTNLNDPSQYYTLTSISE